MTKPSSYFVVRKRKQQNKTKKNEKLACHQSGMEPCACRVRFVAQRALFLSCNYGSSGLTLYVPCIMFETCVDKPTRCNTSYE